ncbi:PAS domain S-box protein [Prosthecobacter sp.]|uniref:PAS domain S-box protein n=1 Tax=Prosthecobacter sp. TaxID=1965333 RepID=UPI001D6A7A55|nr:PAS domain S-box protein [Prosthecobacter sp.]MCB1278030.1 PAS domain S-box protein [Prosthecobacter sp.]
MKARKSRSAVVSTAEEDPHHMVVNDLTETICRFRRDGTLTYVNEVFCRVFGMKRENLVGHRWQPVAYADDVAMIEAKLALLTPKNPVGVIENRIYDAAGRVRWMQFINRAFFDAKGLMQEIQSVGRDITERVLAEQRLHEGEERWKFALESSGFGVWDWDITQDKVFRSSQFKIMLGYASNESVADGVHGWEKTLHPEDLAGTKAAVNDHLLQKTDGFAREFRLQCKDGSWKWVMGRGKVISRDSRGVALRMTGTLEDISRRKAAEEREAHNLKLIVDGAPCAAVLEAIVRTVEAGHPDMRCSVMLANDAGTHLKLHAAPSLPDYVRKALDGLPIAPDVGICSVATHTGKRVICSDVLAESRLAPFHKLASKAKLHSCWSEPVVTGSGKVLGAFACYRRDIHTPDQMEIQAIIAAARLAALAIEREQQEKELEISEERYSRAMRATTDGLWDWNIVTGQTYLSPRWKEILGFAEEELSGGTQESFLSRLHPEDLPRLLAARKAHFEKRAPYQVEFRLRTKGEEYRWFVARGEADWNEKGEAVRMIGTISDIEERKRAEQALRESEKRFRAVFEQAAVGMAEIETPTGHYLNVNQRMCEINRRTREEMLKLTFMDVTYPEDLKDDLNQMEDLKAGRISSFNMEKRNMDPDGNLTWINLTVSPMWLPGEPPLRHVAVVEDITERKQTELKYRRELAYNEALVSHTSAFIVVLDLDGRFVHANSAFYSTMGYVHKQVIGKTPWEIGLMDPAETVRSKERFARLLRGEDNPPADSRLRTKGGEWRSVELRSTATRKPDGSLDRIVVTGTDMTERNRLQQEVLRVVEQEQARVGHDLHDGVGQTMTGIVVMMEALEAELKGAAKAQALRIHELLRQSVSEVRRMSHGLSPTGVKYRGFVGALQLLAETVRTNFRTPCDCQVDASIDISNSDIESHLFRIAQEAVNNALRHGKPTQVKLSLQRVSSSECELRIEDDGTGLKKLKSEGHNGIGVRVMDYRANLIGARLTIHTKPKRGVIVTCRFPCESSKKR